ncbi:hypothetical protein FGB62_89g118 [Gracilaria domingensis]|nr:hypothetical protein FGB62_89g118 [Gracilaria domingensis]
MSRALRLLLELHETLQIMAGDMLPNSVPFHDPALEEVSSTLLQAERIARRCINSIANADIARGNARAIRLVKPVARDLCRKLCTSLNTRLGILWKPVATASIDWDPSNEDQDLHLSGGIATLAEGRRVLLFHLAALLDINECELEFVGSTQYERDVYFHLLYGAQVREIQSLDECSQFSTTSLETLADLFHTNMRQTLKENGRKEPEEALMFWKSANERPGVVSPVPFNTVARALLASQASSAAAERLFSNIGRREGSQCQSLLSGTKEMCETIRVFVRNELRATDNVQRGLLHVRGEAFRRVARTIASMVWHDNGGGGND